MIELKSTKIAFIILGLLLIYFGLNGCTQKTEYEMVAQQVLEENPGQNCVYLSEELNNKLLELGYDSRTISGDVWRPGCEIDEELPLKCFEGWHKWVELDINGNKIWLESTEGRLVREELKKYYVPDEWNKVEEWREVYGLL